MKEELKEEIQKFRDGAEIFRTNAKLYDEMADVLEDENLTEEEKEEKAEGVMGRILVAFIKAQSLFS